MNLQQQHPYTLLAEVIEERDAGAWWRSQAACLGMPVDMFYPEKGVNIVPAARDACGRCPVTYECLRESVLRSSWGDAGVRGGVSAVERRVMRRVLDEGGEVVTRHGVIR